MRKWILPLSIVLFIGLIVIVLNINTKDAKEQIFDYVFENEEVILDGISEINKLSDNLALDFDENVVGVGNAKINRYADDIEGLYVDIKGTSEVRRIEIENEILMNILNGKPVENIGIDNGIIIFDCGGKGIAPSSQDYAFYYSPNDEPFAVFDGCMVGETLQMMQEGKGYKYIDGGGNAFYTEKITDNLYFCEAHF